MDERKSKAKKKRKIKSTKEVNKQKKPKAPKAELPALQGLSQKNALWTLNLNQPRGFVEIVEVLGSVLTNCTWSVITPKENFDQKSVSKSQLSADPNPESFSGLYVECIDAQHCCIVFAKLQGDVVINQELLKEGKISKEDMTFCVSMPLLLTHIKSVSSNNCLQVFKKATGSRLHMKVFSPVPGRHFRLMTLDTLNKEREGFEVSDIDYDYTVEFNLFELRNIVKMAKGINCDHLRFRIMERKIHSPDNVCYFVVHIYGETSYDEQVFCSNTSIDVGQKSQGKSMVIKNAEMTLADHDPAQVKLSDLEDKYNNIFAVEYLNSFLKALNQHTIVLRLAPDRPMIMTSSLGDEHSFVSFVLAPRENDDDLPNIVHSFDTSE
jgi:hypothetical protein